MAFPNIFGANGHGKDQHEFEEGDDDYDQTVFVISTVEEGVNSGKNTILRAATLEESDELQQMQATKKQTLMSNEVAKMAELERKHVEEISTFESEQDAVSAQLEQDATAQLEALTAFYKA